MFCGRALRWVLRSNRISQLGCSVVSDSLRPHGLQHARPPYPSPIPEVYSNSCLLSQWWPSNYLILCCPLLLIFSNESVLCIRWSKYWNFSFSISPSIEYSGLISFRIDWWDLIAVEGTLKSLFQHRSSKTSILQCSAFFRVQLSFFWLLENP